MISVIIYELGAIELQRTLVSHVFNIYRLWVLPLHSTITGAEQLKVFNDPPSPDQRKVILATNIAESSITVTDVKYGKSVSTQDSGHILSKTFLI